MRQCQMFELLVNLTWHLYTAHIGDCSQGLFDRPRNESSRESPPERKNGPEPHGPGPISSHSSLTSPPRLVQAQLPSQVTVPDTAVRNQRVITLLQTGKLGQRITLGDQFENGRRIILGMVDLMLLRKG